MFIARFTEANPPRSPIDIEIRIESEALRLADEYIVNEQTRPPGAGGRFRK